MKLHPVFIGGSVGDVTVDWHVRSGLAMRNVDFLGDDATLKFAHGETRKGNEIMRCSTLVFVSPTPSVDYVVMCTKASGTCLSM